MVSTEYSLITSQLNLCLTLQPAIPYPDHLACIVAQYREPNVMELLPPEAPKPLMPASSSQGLHHSDLLGSPSPPRARPGLLPPLEPARYSPEDQRLPIRPTPVTTPTCTPMSDSIIFGGKNDNVSTPSCNSNTLGAWLEPKAEIQDGTAQHWQQQPLEGVQVHRPPCSIIQAGKGKDGGGDNSAVSATEVLAQVQAVIRDLARGRPQRPATTSGMLAPSTGEPSGRLEDPQVGGVTKGGQDRATQGSNPEARLSQDRDYERKRQELELLHSELESKMRELQDTDSDSATSRIHIGGGSTSAQGKGAAAAILDVEERIRRKLTELAVLATAATPPRYENGGGSANALNGLGGPASACSKPPAAVDGDMLTPQVLDVLSACKKRNASSRAEADPERNKDRAVGPSHSKGVSHGGGGGGGDEIQSSLGEIEKIIGKRIAHMEKLTNATS